MQGDLGGAGFAEVAKWIVGATMSPCQKTGTVWSCAVSTSAGAAQIMWDAAQTCSAGSCTTAPQTVDAKFGHYVDLADATQPVTAHSVPVGAKPVMLLP